MATSDTQSESASSESASEQMTTAAKVRCLLALLCSHVAAPYAAARLTIRYQLQGDFEQRYAVIAGVAISVGLLLSFRQLVNQPAGRKWLYGTVGVVLWLVVAFVLLAVAAESAIPAPVLGTLWAAGSLWIAWSIWAWCFFRSRGVLLGTIVVAAVAIPFWMLVEATGIRGNNKVEFAWRQPRDRPSISVEENRQSAAADVIWTGYLGANRDGVITDITLNEDWAARPPQKLWQQDCGLGWSSFAVTRTTLFGQEQLDSGDCVTARDVETGELLWTVAEGRDGFRSGLGGDGPRATPTLYSMEDGESRLVLFTVGPTGLLSCLKASSGDVIWQSDLMAEFPGESLVHGVCGSPLVIDDLVVVSPPTDSGPGLVAFSLADGSVAWKCSSDWRASYASPALMTICDRVQIVLHAGPGVMGVEPSSGKVLWQYEWTNEFDNNATQPLQAADEPNDLFVATGYQGGVARISITANDSGELQAKEVWNNRRTMKTKFCNLAQFGDVVVGLDNGILCAVDAKNGKRLWKKGRYGHGQMLKVNDHLLIVEEKGDVQLLKPDRKGHHPIGDSIPALDRKSWSHPVLIDDRLVVRNDQQIVCLRLPLDGGPADEGSAKE